MGSSLKDLQGDLQKYLRNLLIKRRQPAATHVLAILVSEERRNRKPYAIPVHFYALLLHQGSVYLRCYCQVKTEMVKMDLKPVGRSHDSMQIGFSESHNEYNMKFERVKGNV